MPDHVDAHFHDRVDAHIELANEQLDDSTRVRVSASMLHATARFHAWLAACGFASAAAMAEARDRLLQQYVAQFRDSLAENLDDYIAHFDDYMTDD
jgi:methylphosphotriester-DNA--protein-cysteine methyltransferase